MGMFHWLFYSHRPKVRVVNSVPLDSHAVKLLKRVELASTFAVTSTEDNRPVILLTSEKYGTTPIWESLQQYPSGRAAQAAAHRHLCDALNGLLFATERIDTTDDRRV